MKITPHTPCSFCFETNRVDPENHHSFYFEDPIELLVLDNPHDLEEFFKRLSQLNRRYYAAGFFSYELGYLLEDRFPNPGTTSFPYALFGIFRKARIINSHKGANPPNRFSNAGESGRYRIRNSRLSVSHAEYIRTVRLIREHIARGNIYQADYTFKYKFKFSGSAWGLYQDLKMRQHVSYNAFMHIGRYKILSLSPELFFRKKGDLFTVRPMKGTISRGMDLAEDEERKYLLATDPKNRSENAMIVDLLRNDLGKISRNGTVRVRDRFAVERYDTLFQMTSTIESRLRKNVSIREIIQSIFPSGSVTGAPKIRSMEILRGLETEDRKIYTGAIGFFEPGGNATFNVAIRTILLDSAQGEMGIGSGIVTDSKAEEEFRECVLKARFLVKDTPSFNLIETMRYDGAYRNLERHLQRLSNSARYFGFRFDGKKLHRDLSRLKKKLRKGMYKVRILLGTDGKTSISHKQIFTVPSSYSLVVANPRTDSGNPFRYHKTTNREILDRELQAVRKKGFFDAVFFNEKGEVTEGAVTNIYVKKKGQIFTPPVSSGLLNGTIRKGLIDKKEVRERILTLKDLQNADEILISNAVIGLVSARLEKN